MKKKQPAIMARILVLSLLLGSAALLTQCSGDSDLSKEDNSALWSGNSLKSGPGSCPRKCALSAGTQFGMKKVLILTPAGDLKAHRQAEQALGDLGGRVLVSLPGEGFLAMVPEEKEAELGLLKEILLVSAGRVEGGSIPGLSRRQNLFLEKWTRKMGKVSEPGLEPEPAPPPDDALTRPPSSGEIENVFPSRAPENFSSELPFSAQIAPAPAMEMSGTVAVGVFFPESNGAIDQDRESWNGMMVDNVLVEIAMGLDWWATMAPVDRNLNFAIYYYNPLSEACLLTSYEPITRPYPDEALWIGQIMACLGYNSGGYFARVDSFNSWLMSYAGAAQAYSVFVVNDWNDRDNAFAGDGRSYFAYAYLGGPLEVMTYDNDGYGIGNLDSVHAHETGHIFWAYDEYASSQCHCRQSHNNCVNNNCANNCLLNECCVMRGGVRPFTRDCLCGCTRGQVGWDCFNCAPPDCAYLVLSPDGGESWRSGSRHSIRWIAAGTQCSARVVLKYKYKGQKTWKKIAASAENNGSYSWTLPDRDGPAQVRVLDYNNHKFAKDTGGYFTIK